MTFLCLFIYIGVKNISFIYFNLISFFLAPASKWQQENIKTVSSILNYILHAPLFPNYPPNNPVLIQSEYK